MAQLARQARADAQQVLAAYPAPAGIRRELDERVAWFESRGQLLEAQRERAVEMEQRARRIREIQDHVARLPKFGPGLTDADLYDESGLPK